MSIIFNARSSPIPRPYALLSRVCVRKTAADFAGARSCEQNGFGCGRWCAKKVVCFGRLRTDAPGRSRRTELELGYHILRAMWGRGYATAARACRDFCLRTLEAPRSCRSSPAKHGFAGGAEKCMRHARFSGSRRDASALFDRSAPMMRDVGGLMLDM